jgi:hypothetical protein
MRGTSVQDALTPELGKSCGNPECDTAPDTARKVYCSPKCARRANYLRRGGKEYIYTYTLASRYGMTAEEYRRRAAEQDGRCAICREEPEDGKRLHVDHNHETGAVRALLCRWCNYALGNAKDDPERLRAMAAYLERHEEGGARDAVDGRPS